MKDIAPNILRQRLLIEAFYTKDIDQKIIENYFYGITTHLGLKTYGKPIIFSPAGMGKAENQGYDAFIPLIDSGISLYVWASAKFLSVVIYTCKSFVKEKAITYTKNYFGINTDQIEYMSF